MARGKAGKEELVGEGDAKLPDWEGQPIRNLRSIKLEREVRTRLSFIDARLFLSPTALSFLFFNPRSRPSYPFVHSSFAPRPRNPFLHFKERRYSRWRPYGILQAFGY